MSIQYPLLLAKWLIWKLIPRTLGSMPAIAVPMGRAIAIPFNATAVPTGLEAAKPCSPITARPGKQNEKF